MAHPVEVGAVYKVLTQTWKPPHYYIVLNEPNAVDGSFVTISLTDRNHFLRITDIWPTGYRICDAFELDKPSILFPQWACIANQIWLNERDAEYVCVCTETTLERARHGIISLEHYLDPAVKKYCGKYRFTWRLQ
jgi:hypothetical protein